MKIVMVKWLDAHLLRPALEWRSVDEIELEAALLVEAGILVKENDDVIALAQELDVETTTYRSVTIIPKCGIVDRKDFEIKK